LKNTASLKKKINYIILFLVKNLFHFKLVAYKTGIRTTKFVGFKIKLAGRFENSKNGMANKFIYKFGKVNSTNLQITVTFIRYIFYTKLGISNLKI